MQMLVLGRNSGQQVVVPHCRLTITVLAIKGKTVRLGISAPPGVLVYRDELARRPGDDPQRRQQCLSETDALPPWSCPP
jgi:carbon storage regulator CsrA